MPFYTRQHKHYCGVDLHTRNMYVCVLDAAGEKLLHRKLAANREQFLAAIAPYRENLVLAVECMHCWYWLADLCAEHEIPFVLGHAFSMRLVHGSKSKNDRIDSERIARLLRGGLIPQAYVYPRDLRGTRDLMRRRTHLVRKRTELLSHLQGLNAQENLPPYGKRLTSVANREGLSELFDDPSVARSAAADCELIDHYDVLIPQLERFIERHVKEDRLAGYYLLRTVPGIGKILSMTLLCEIHDISRFPTVGRFASYARLVRCHHTSDDKIKGRGGKKMGNMHLKWAFSEAASLFLRCNPRGRKLFEQLEKQHGRGEAMSILAHKIGRAVYFMLKRKESFDAERFYTSSAA